MSRGYKSIISRIAMFTEAADIHLLYMLVPFVGIILVVPELSIVWLGIWLLLSQGYLLLHVYEEYRMGHEWVDYLLCNEILIVGIPAMAVPVACWLGPFRPRS